ncbi:efflux RND transporter permease subunit [Rhodanobacter sp. AS-Z3]|uniref:efflux RND transporter permease subunit n=1 Tax=Rhodanobacter sp. AS-Z3 TaxID=3031330 RepID=UPI00247865A0|nr:efflux RND transporter permease subunit [Rhodanobacter sp. AS-Z3]WEN15642.1 efflux RND transporter permease subunit [Rhodanobacter sp. AS-Z3]
MNIFAPLIRRPVGTSLLAIGLMLAGLWAYLLLGVAALPTLEFPGVFVAAQMPGASAPTMASTVMAPLERHLGRIPGVRMMMGTANDGSAQVMVIFNFGVNIDSAAREVQAAINAAAPDLPSGMANPPQYFKFDTSQIPVLLVALTSTSLPPDKLFDLTDSMLKPAVAQVNGVARVQVFGGAAHAVRIELDTPALVAKGITVNDVSNALRAANVTSPQGVISNGYTRMTVTANDSLHDPAEFGRLLIAMKNGIPVRLSDVARISSGPEDQYQAAWFNGQRAVTMQISKRADANAVATANAVRAKLPEFRALLPADVQITPIFDLTQTTQSALHEVEIALLMSIVMVALVMLVFLRRLRPTLIAMLSVPLSLAGAFVVMWVLGFSLNTLSLIALVLCIGFVVDDAIVVIENIVRHMERGTPPLEAALLGVREIGFTVISITLSLIAVFAPMLFGNNMFTMLMREFSVTLTAAVVISAVVSLTLTPALCGRYLKREHAVDQREPNRLQQMLERFDNGLLQRYQVALDWALHHRRLMRWQPAILLVLTALLAVAVAMTAGGGIMPDEDIGLMQANVRAEANISPTLMATRAQQVAAVMQADPAVLDVSTVLGGGGGSVGNNAQMFIDLKPYGNGPQDRHDKVKDVIKRLDQQYKLLADVDVTLSAVQFLGGGGGGGGGGQGRFLFQLTSSAGASLQQPTLKLAQQLRAMKDFRDVGTSFDSIGKEQLLTVDRETAASLQVSMAAIDGAIYDAFGEKPVSIIYSDTNQYRVVLTSSAARTLTPASLLQTHVRNSRGQMIPLSALASIAPSIAPVQISHVDQLESASISYNLADGVSVLQGMKLVDKVVAGTLLPPGVQKKYAGDNQQLLEAASGAGLMLLAVILVMYVVLGILYESLIHPLTILSTLPAAGMGAYLAMLVTQTELTLMSIIAILMLIGIVKKNAILMVDFALVAERERGLSAPAAIREAALVRFRPITMTTLVAMGAAIPLVVGFGVGSEMRQPLGIAIFGGLLVSQLLTLLSTPAIYLWQHDRRERKAARQALRAEIQRQRLLQQHMPALPK